MCAPISAIEFVHVNYRTADGRTLLSDVNFSVSRGEMLMLLGPSGSGKTTSLKLINERCISDVGFFQRAGVRIFVHQQIPQRLHPWK